MNSLLYQAPQKRAWDENLWPALQEAERSK